MQLAACFPFSLSGFVSHRYLLSMNSTCLKQPQLFGRRHTIERNGVCTLALVSWVFRLHAAACVHRCSVAKLWQLLTDLYGPKRAPRNTTIQTVDTLFLENFPLPSFKKWVNVEVHENDCIEVLHYSSKNQEYLTKSVWMFPQTGTGVFYNIGRLLAYIGRLLAFTEHFEFNNMFLPIKNCTLSGKCRFVSMVAVNGARAQNVETVQFKRHTQDRADGGIPKNELMDLRSTNLNKLMSHARFGFQRPSTNPHIDL